MLPSHLGAESRLAESGRLLSTASYLGFFRALSDVCCSSYISICYFNSIYTEKCNRGEESIFRHLKLKIPSFILSPKQQKLSETYKKCLIVNVKLTWTSKFIIQAFETFDFASFLSALYFARTLSQLLGNWLVLTKRTQEVFNKHLLTDWWNILTSHLLDNAFFVRALR